MLRGYNDIQLKECHVDDNLIYFYQLWQELVDNRTLDVYQCKICNSYVAIVELIGVIDKTIDGLFTTDDNIECCRLETLSLVKNDDILEKYEKPLQNRLLKHLGEKVSKACDKRALKHQLSYAKNKLSSTYLKYIFDELKTDILSQSHNLIKDHTNALISQCIFNGWSLHALFDTLRFFVGQNTLDEKWNSFKTHLTSNTKIPHDVLLSISIIANKNVAQEQVIDTLRSLGLEVKPREEYIGLYESIADIETFLKSNRFYIRVPVTAPDIYSAAHLGIRIFSDKVNIASFYNIIVAWDLKNTKIYAINTLTKYKKPLKAEDLYGTYDYLDSSSKIFDSTKEIFLDSTKKLIQSKLKGAFAYTNISRASLFQEEKYNCLWIAMESLCRTDMYQNIIGNVKDTLPSALCLRYIYQIVRNFVQDCERCNVNFEFSNKTIDINQESKLNLVRETIAMLKEPTLFSELKSKCTINQLLLERCNDVHKLVTDLSYATSKITNHHQKIEWQIQRLYRIRNEITHSAQQNESSLILYIEYLYDYLAVFISEIVTFIKNKNLDSLEEVYCVIKDNYDSFSELALSKDSPPPGWEKDLFISGIIDLVV